MFKIYSKIGVLIQSQSVLFGSVALMTTLPVTRVMDVRNQTNRASVTRSGPSRDRSCQFVYRPQEVMPADPRQVQASQDDLRANF